MPPRQLLALLLCVAGAAAGPLRPPALPAHAAQVTLPAGTLPPLNATVAPGVLRCDWPPVCPLLRAPSATAGALLLRAVDTASEAPAVFGLFCHPAACSAGNMTLRFAPPPTPPYWRTARFAELVALHSPELLPTPRRAPPLPHALAALLGGEHTLRRGGSGVWLATRK